MTERLVLAVTCPYANAGVRAHVERWLELAARRQYRDLARDMNEQSYSED